MSVRRLLVSLGLVLVTSACAENLSSPTPVDAGPHFLRWAPSAQPSFTAHGAASEGFVSANGGRAYLNGGTVTAPSVDASTQMVVNGLSSLTWSHTVGTGANRLLVVGVATRNANNTVAAVSYMGLALTRLGAQNNSDGAVRAELWYLVAPPSGSGTVSVTLSAKAKAVAGAISFSGVDPVAPLRGIVMAGSSGTGSTNPVVADSSGMSELVVAALAAQGSAGTVTPLAGQTQSYVGATGPAGGEALGAGSTVPGASGMQMGWNTTALTKWAIVGVVVKPYAPATLGLTAYQVTFWAVNGQSRSVQIDYSAGGGTSPFLKLTTTNPTYAPGKGNIAVGDSVLVTATVYPNTIGVDLEPTGLLFGTPASLTLWYGGAGGDLNGDGVVNAADSTIATQLLGMWYQEGTSNPWTSISATQSLTQQSFTTPLAHFSGYAVSW